MSVLFSLVGNPDVKSAVVGDTAGVLLEALGEIDAEKIAAEMGAVANRLSRTGKTLRLGKLQRIDLTNRGCFLAIHDSTVVTVYLTPHSSRENVEKAVANIEWGKIGDSNSILLEIEDESREVSRPTGENAESNKIGNKAKAVRNWADAEYESFKKKLSSVLHDNRAITNLVTAQTNHEGWIATAYSHLRNNLADGDLVDSEALGNLIGAVLEINDNGAKDELGDSCLHREAMTAIIQGIGAIQMGDNLAGIKHLEIISEKVFANESLRWVANYWIAYAACGSGENTKARSTAELSLELAEKLDAQAKSKSTFRLAEIEFFEGNFTQALHYLNSARGLANQLGDSCEQARGWLLEAQILASTGRNNDSERAALQAQELNPNYIDSVIFLARQALKENKLWKAEAKLRELYQVEPVPPEVLKEMKVLELIRQGNVPFLVAIEYLNFSEALPSNELISKLENLLATCPDFLYLKETLAWKLLKLGKYEEAAVHFKELVERELDPHLKASVLLGLGAVGVSVQPPSRPSELRLKAVAQTTAPSPGKSIEPAPTSLVQEVVAPSPAITSIPRPSGAMYSLRSASSGASAAAVFTGELQLFAVPDLMEFLKTGQRTGALVISSEHGVGAVYLRRGKVIGATSPNCLNIGDILLAGSKITKEQLGQATEIQAKDPTKMLGAILVELSFVDRSKMLETMTTQIYSAVRELISWPTGRFVFEAETEESVQPSDLELELDTQCVLLDIFRQMDEENRDSF
jgi:Flp pilus assembly protein TadD